MLRLILFFILLTGASIGASWLADNDGTLSIEWLGYHIDTTITFAITSVFLTVILGIIFTEFLLWIFSVPKRIKTKMQSSKNDKALLALAKGFSAIAVMDTKKAKSASTEALKLLDGKPISIILAAETAQIEGNTENAEKHFSTLLENKHTEFVGIKGLLAIAREKQDIPRAIELAQKSFRLNPTGKDTANILLSLYKQTGKWSDAQLFLEKLKNRNDLDIKKEKAFALFMRAKKFHDNEEYKKTFDLVMRANKLQPDFIPAALLCMDIALHFGKKRKAALVCEKAWKTSPHPELALKYLSIYDTKHIKRALKLLSINSKHFESYRVVARAALDAGDITVARNNAKLAMTFREAVSLDLLMADIEKISEDRNEQNVQQWLEKAKNSPPDPVWACKKCGHYSSDKYEEKCNHCSAIGTLEWDYNPENAVV